MDMEMIQYHPTTLQGNGLLITEGARGEGAHLYNAQGERFMEKYAPNKMELASRDVVSRAEQTEINEGRGFPDGTVALDITVVPRKRIHEALREIVMVGRDFAGVDITKEPIHIKPGNHYIMGGVKTDVDGQTDDPRPLRRRRGGLRLGPRRQPPGRQLAARHADLRRPLGRARRAQRAQGRIRCPSPREASLDDEDDDASARSSAATGSGRRVSEIKAELGATMDKYVAVFRDEAGPQQALEIVRRLKEEAKTVAIDDKGTVFNQDVLGAIELGFMLDNAEAIVLGAIERKESRGAQFRTDYPGAQRRGVAQAHRHHARRRTSPKISYSDGDDDASGSPRNATLLMDPMPTTRSRSAASTPSPGEPRLLAGLRRRARARALGARRHPPGARTTQDGSIGIRCSCQAAICGSCGVRINGKSRAGLQHAARRRGRGRRDDGRRDRRRADGQHARDQGPDRRHGRGPLEEGPARRAVAAARGRPARARVHRPARVDDRHHPVDGLHPLRRLRVGLPVAGGRPRVHRPGRARQGLPLRRRPARRATEDRLRDLAEDPHGIYDCTHCFACVEVCPKDVAPMNQIMRLRRRATDDYEIKDRNNGYGHEKAFATSSRSGARCTRRSCCRARSARAAGQGPVDAGGGQAAARRCRPPCAGSHPARSRPARRCCHHKLPDQKNVRRIYKEIESKDERLELNLYIVGEDRRGRGARPKGGQESMKVAYWPGCVSRGFTPELHGSMELVAPKLDLELVELDRANCCGAGVIAEHNQELADTLNARTFAMAQGVDGAGGMMNICSTCQGAQSECQERLDADADYREHINAHLDARGPATTSATARGGTRTSSGCSSRRSASTSCSEQVVRPLDGPARSRRSTAATSCARPAGSATRSTPTATVPRAGDRGARRRAGRLRRQPQVLRLPGHHDEQGRPRCARPAATWPTRSTPAPTAWSRRARSAT